MMHFSSMEASSCPGPQLKGLEDFEKNLDKTSVIACKSCKPSYLITILRLGRIYDSDTMCPMYLTILCRNLHYFT